MMKLVILKIIHHFIFLIEKIKVDKEVNAKDIIDKIGFNFKIGEISKDFTIRNSGISIQNIILHLKFKIS